MSCIDKRKLTVKRHLLFMISSNFSISSSFVKFVFKILFRQLIFHLTSPPQSSPLFIEFDYNWEPIALSKTSYWGESIIVVQSSKAWWLSLGRNCLLKWKDEKWKSKHSEFQLLSLLHLLKWFPAQSGLISDFCRQSSLLCLSDKKYAPSSLLPFKTHRKKIIFTSSGQSTTQHHCSSMSSLL